MFTEAGVGLKKRQFGQPLTWKRAMQAPIVNLGLVVSADYPVWGPRDEGIS